MSSAGEPAPSAPAHVLDGGGPATIGVLIHVPEPLAGRVERFRRSISDDLVAIPTHVTLVPPTVLDADAMEGFVRHVADVARTERPFRIHLRGTGTFRPVTDVVYLRLVDGHEACDRLQRRLRQGPTTIDVRYPYHPHVTVAHDVGQDALDRAGTTMAGVDETFTVDRFVLYVDRSDGDWVPVREFSLGRG